MSEQHVVTALREKRAALDGERHQAEKRLVQLQADLATIDAALRIFDPTIAPHTIKPRKPRKLHTGFPVGDLSRAVLDVLRRADAPLTVREIATRVAAQRGLDVSTSARMQPMIGRVRNVLSRRRDSVVSETVGDVMRWRVA